MLEASFHLGVWISSSNPSSAPKHLEMMPSVNLHLKPSASSNVLYKKVHYVSPSKIGRTISSSPWLMAYKLKSSALMPPCSLSSITTYLVSSHNAALVLALELHHLRHIILIPRLDYWALPVHTSALVHCSWAHASRAVHLFWMCVLPNLVFKD